MNLTAGRDSDIDNRKVRYRKFPASLSHCDIPDLCYCRANYQIHVMTHLVTRMFDGFVGRSSRSNNGLAIFCACVCVFTCSFSMVTSAKRNPGPSEEFFELATDLKSRIRRMDEMGIELVPAGHEDDEYPVVPPTKYPTVER